MTQTGEALSCLVGVLCALLLVGGPVTAQDSGEGCCNVVDCELSAWSDWGECSELCGGTGTRSRERWEIVEARNGGYPCNDTLVEYQTCNFDPCLDEEVDCPPQPVDILFMVDAAFEEWLTRWLRAVTVTLKKNDILGNANKANETVRIAYARFDHDSAYYSSCDGGDCDTNDDWDDDDVLEADFSVEFWELFDQALQTTDSGGQADVGLAYNWGLKELMGHPWARDTDVVSGNGLRPDRAGARKVMILVAGDASASNPVPACDNPLADDVEVFTFFIRNIGGNPYTPNNDREAQAVAELKQLASHPQETHFTRLFVMDNMIAGGEEVDLTFETGAFIQSVLQAPGSTCEVYGRNHINTFDGNSYQFPSPGEYYLVNECPEEDVADFLDEFDSFNFDPLESDYSLIVQARVVPCETRSTEEEGRHKEFLGNSTEDFVWAYDEVGGALCIRGYAVSDGEDSIEFIHDASLGLLLVRENGNDPEDDLTGSNSVGGIRYSVIHRLDTGWVVDIFMEDPMHSIHLSFSELSSTAIIVPGYQLRGVGNGLCGKYDGCPANDFTARNQETFPVDSSTLYEDFAVTWRVAREESLFNLEGRQSYNPDDGQGSLKVFDAEYVKKLEDNASEEELFDCERFPVGALRSSCLHDMMLGNFTSPADAMADQTHVLVTQCSYYCLQGRFLSAADFKDPARGVFMQPVCDRVCRYIHPLDPEEFYGLPSLHFAGGAVDNSIEAGGDAIDEYASAYADVTLYDLGDGDEDNTDYLDDNGLPVLPEVIILGKEIFGMDKSLPSASFLFNAATNFGGRYVFQQTVRRHDACSEPRQHDQVITKNVTVSIACMELPDAEIISDDDGTDNVYVVYGRSMIGYEDWPTVQLEAAVDVDRFDPDEYSFQPRLRYSWKVISFASWDYDPDDDDDEIEYDGLPMLEFPNSLYPTFTPQAAGTYVIEFALSDECSIARYRTKVTAVQRCCMPQVQLSPVRHLYFRGVDSDSDDFNTAWNWNVADENGVLGVTGSSLDADFSDLFNQPLSGDDEDIVYEWSLKSVSRTPYGSPKVAPEAIEEVDSCTGIFYANGGSPAGGSKCYKVTYIARPETKMTPVGGNTTLEIWNTTDDGEFDDADPERHWKLFISNGYDDEIDDVQEMIDPDDLLDMRLADLPGQLTDRFGEAYYSQTYLDEATIVQHQRYESLTYWNQFVQYREPAITETCIVVIEDPYTQDDAVLRVDILQDDVFDYADPESKESLYTKGRYCEGFWVLEQRTYVDGYEDRCDKKQQVVVQATCGAGPVAGFDCENLVEFDYDDREFPAIALDATESHDMTDTERLLQYKWIDGRTGQQMECENYGDPEEMQDFGDGWLCVKTPQEEGDYPVALEVSNGCKTAQATGSYSARCLDPIEVDDLEPLIIRRETRSVVQGYINVTRNGDWKVYHHDKVVAVKEDDGDYEFEFDDVSWGDVVGFEITDTYPDGWSGEPTEEFRSSFIAQFWHRGVAVFTTGVDGADEDTLWEWQCGSVYTASWYEVAVDPTELVGFDQPTELYTNGDLVPLDGADVTAHWIWTGEQGPYDPPGNMENTIYCRVVIPRPPWDGADATIDTPAMPPAITESGEGILNSTSTRSPVFDLDLAGAPGGWVGEWPPSPLELGDEPDDVRRVNVEWTLEEGPIMEEWEEDLFEDYFGHTDEIQTEDLEYVLYEWEDIYTQASFEVHYPGTYVFELYVTDGCTEETVEQEVNFRCHTVANTNFDRIATFANITELSEPSEWDVDERDYSSVVLTGVNSEVDYSLDFIYQWRVEDWPLMYGEEVDVEDAISYLDDSSWDDSAYPDTPAFADVEDNTIEFTPLLPGDYAVRLTIFDGCEFDSVVFNFTVACDIEPANLALNLTYQKERLLNEEDGLLEGDVVYVVASHDEMDDVDYTFWTVIGPDGTVYDEGDLSLDVWDDDDRVDENGDPLEWDDWEYAKMFAPDEFGVWDILFTSCNDCFECTTVSTTIEVVCKHRMHTSLWVNASEYPEEVEMPLFTAEASEAQDVTFERSGWPCVHVHGDDSYLNGDDPEDFTYTWYVIGVEPAVEGEMSAYAPERQRIYRVGSRPDDDNDDGAAANPDRGDNREEREVETSTYYFPAGSAFAGMVQNVTQIVTQEFFETWIFNRFEVILTNIDDPSISQDQWNAFPVSFHPDIAGNYTLELVVTDDCGLVSTSQTSVTAMCAPQPTVRGSVVNPGVEYEDDVAYLDMGKEEYLTVLLRAEAGVSDRQSKVLYQWMHAAGTDLDAVEDIVNDQTSFASLQVNEPGTYAFTLRVTDGCSWSEVETVTVVVERECTTVVDEPETKTRYSPFNYLNPTMTETYTLRVPSSFEALSSSVRTTLPEDEELPEDFYEDYGGLRCDPYYEWDLKDYFPEPDRFNFDPCSEDDQNLDICSFYRAELEVHNAKLRNQPTPPPVEVDDKANQGDDEGQTLSPDANETPVTEMAWFVVLMVLLALGIVIGLTLMLKKKGGNNPQYQAAES